METQENTPAATATTATTPRAETPGRTMRLVRHLFNGGFTTIGIQSGGEIYLLNFEGAVFTEDGLGASGVRLVSGPDLLVQRLREENLTTISVRQALTKTNGVHIDIGGNWRTFGITKIFTQEEGKVLFLFI